RQPPARRILDLTVVKHPDRLHITVGRMPVTLHKEIVPIVPDIKVGFILAPQFSLLPFAGFVDALRHAADEDDNSRQIYCTWTTIASSRSMITASCGLQVAPETTFASTRAFDYLVVVGGLVAGCLKVDDETLAYIRAAYAGG